MRSTWKDQTFNKDIEGPMQFIYYMTILEDSPCKICVIQPLCGKSFLNETACFDLGTFIIEKIKEIQDEDKD